VWSNHLVLVVGIFTDLDILGYRNTCGSTVCNILPYGIQKLVEEIIKKKTQIIIIFSKEILWNQKQ
jgi:hypothetical protein